MVITRRRGAPWSTVRCGPRDVTDLRIIAALLEVPRELFVAPSRRAVAYLDLDVPVADGSPRALLKPMVFGKLLQAAGIKETDRVLDVGCATGYSAAVLARLAGQWWRWKRMRRSRAPRLRTCPGPAMSPAATGPLAAGWAQGGPYDVILLEGAQRGRARAAAARNSTISGRLLAVIGGATDGEGHDLHARRAQRDQCAAVRCRRAAAARLRQAARIRVLAARHYRCARSDLPQD